MVAQNNKEYTPKHLRINMLGHFQLTLDNQLIEGLQADRYQSLLAYLVLCAQTPQPRREIANALWPETGDDTKAKTNLRRELHRFRQMLPEVDHFVRVTAQTLQWHPQSSFWSDVGEFEEKLGQVSEQTTTAQRVESLKQAVELYQGELLPGCRHKWIEPERYRLNQLL